MKIMLVLLLIIFSTSKFYSNKRLFKPSQEFTISEGLSHNGVTSILEDSKGYIWIGTFDGLNRYDGYEFEVFSNSNNKKILSSNRVRTLIEDSNKNIWIGTENGITLYNNKTEEFQNLYSNTKNKNRKGGPVILQLIEVKSKGLIIALTEDVGILLFSINGAFIGNYMPPKNLSEITLSFNKGILLDKENVLIACTRGLMLFNVEKRIFNWGYEDRENEYTNLSVYKNGQLLVTLNRGLRLYTFNKEGDSYLIKHIQQYRSEEHFIFAEFDKDNQLWVGYSRNGIGCIKNASSFINNENYQEEVFNYPNDLTRLSTVLFTSNNKDVWVGTFNKGVLRFNIENIPFKTYNASMNDPLGLAANEVVGLIRANKNSLYCFDNASKFTLFNVFAEKFEHLDFEIPSSLDAFGISAFVDDKGVTWIKQGNLTVYNNKTGLMEAVTSLCDIPEDFLRLVPREIYQDVYGCLWFAGLRGVYRASFNEKGEIIKIENLKEHELFKNINVIRAEFFYDEELKLLWFGTERNGLFRIGMDKNQELITLDITQFKESEDKPNSLPSDFVSTIIRVPGGGLWVGTERGGICQVKNADKEPEFIAYTTSDGLSHNVVKSILCDGNKYLWIATNKGLNRFDLVEKTFRQFNKGNGLPFESFLYPSVKMNDSIFVFAGSGGLCYFNKYEIPEKEDLPYVEFSKFHLYNELVLPGDTLNGRVILKESISNNPELILSHHENVFSVEVKSLHYSTHENHFIAYQLLPASNDWVKVPSYQNKLNFNGLKPGEYELSVMASNSMNEWTSPQKLNIVIKPPFWKTPLAYGVYVLVVLSIISLVLFIVLKIQSLQHNLEIEHMEREKVSAVNNAKLKFFSNISHEIKTPLTLISGPIDLLYHRLKGNEDLKEKVEIVKRQSKKISQLVDQVHDFQRSDANQLKMNYSLFRMKQFFEEVSGDFKFLAQKDGKEFQILYPKENVTVWADKGKMEKIVNNLLSNSFKYSKKGDKIEISFEVEDDLVIIKVSDTGKGIDKEDLPHVFERFYQSHHNAKDYSGGSGIGLAFSKRLVEMHLGFIEVESEINTGTTVTVKLPIVKSDLGFDQLQNEEEILLEEKDNQLTSISQVISDHSKGVNADGLSDVTVFFAEDNIELRDFVTEQLLVYCHVKSFQNGQECLNAMNEEWPDIVVSDVLMPEMNGFDLCKKIKSDIKTSHIPVILLTACTSIEDKLKGLKLGADSYIQKPFSFEHLIVEIESILNNRKQLRERFKIDYPLTLKKKDFGTMDTAFLDKLYHVLDQNLENQELDVDHLTKELYINRTDFYKKVKVLTNQTPYELIKNFRIKKAADLLVQKQLSVNEVFMMTGFKSRSHFNKYFKENYGVPPGKYTQAVINKYNTEA